MHLNFDQSKQNKQTGFLPLTEGYSSTVLVHSFVISISELVIDLIFVTEKVKNIPK